MSLWVPLLLRSRSTDPEQSGSPGRARRAEEESDEERPVRRRSSRSQPDSSLYDDDVGFWGVCLAFSSCRPGRFGACRLVVWAVVLTVSLWIGITRNLYCTPESLRSVTPPFGGQLLPANFTLVERKYFFQFTKIVDVYDEDKTFVGYFYDINLFIIMRFGFSDPNGRIWFEARYASFISRFKPIVEYNLQRCDAGAGGRTEKLYELKEDWWAENWWCVIKCNRLFNLSLLETPYHVTESLLPRPSFGRNAMARVEFDSFLTPTVRGQVTGTEEMGSIHMKHKWWMGVRNTTNGKEIAQAQQHFVLGGAESDMQRLSRWNVTRLSSAGRELPNWVIAFLAVLDDIEEDVGFR